MFQKLVSDFFLFFFFPRFFPECLRCFFVGLFSYVRVHTRLVHLVFEPASSAQITKKTHTPSSYVELACCRRASTTAQRIAISHAQSSEARTCQSECDNGGKQTEFARTSKSLSIYLQLAAFSKPTKKSNFARPKGKYNHKQRVIREGFAFIHFPISLRYNITTFFFLCRTYFSYHAYAHAAYGLFSWSTELLAFARRQFALSSGPPSASFTLFCSIISL